VLLLPAVEVSCQHTELHSSACNAQERLTLKHKNTSKWARRALRRGVNVMDATTKEAMEEQLRLGLALRQRVRAASMH